MGLGRDGSHRDFDKWPVLYRTPRLGTIAIVQNLTILIAVVVVLANLTVDLVYRGLWRSGII